jgi:hypothetical protein
MVLTHSHSLIKGTWNQSGAGHWVAKLITLILQVAVNHQSTVVTVIVAVPCVTQVTNQLSSTVAIDVLELDHVTFLLYASAGNTVAISCSV